MADELIGDAISLDGPDDLPEYDDLIDRPEARNSPVNLSAVSEIRGVDGRVFRKGDPQWPRELHKVEQELGHERPDPARDRRRAIAWAPWAIVESSIEVVRDVDDPDILDRSMDTLLATLRLVLGKFRSRTTLQRMVIEPDRTGRLVLRRYKGGRRRGWRKGKTLSRRQNLEWWFAWDLDRDPRPEDYAAEIGVKDPQTALGRWRATGLDWPPTTAQLNEIDDDC